MKLRRVRLENVRSFLEPAEFLIEGDISILIGPNGGGKTNLLDAIIATLRRHLLTSWVSRHAPSIEFPDKYEFQMNDAIGSITLEKHNQGAQRQQVIEIEVEVTARDIANIQAMKESATKLADYADKRYTGAPIGAKTSTSSSAC